ncbi:MAG: hypothetical protein F4060_15380 [Holophagales bacterium]|nr:hypothetical protein [Holophagales bacterium]MYG29345.1 hypothetical protein [Holophagales bacterium]MYI81310.1 hypothetical protein [Holophagales bacterium]
MASERRARTAPAGRPDLEEHVQTRIKDAVKEEVDALEERLRKLTRSRWTFLLSTITLLGILGVAYIPGLYIGNEVREQLSDGVEEYYTLFEFERAYQQFFSLSLVDDPRLSLRPQNLAATMYVLEILSERPEELLKRPVFPVQLESLVSILVSAGMDYEINQLDEFIKDRRLLTPNALALLADHYGIRVLGSEQPDSEEVDRLLHYVRQAGLSERDETAIFWPLLLHFRRGQAGGGPNHEAGIEGLLVQVSGLSDEKKSAFFEYFHTFREASRFMKEPNGDAENLAGTVEEFLKQHPEVESSVSGVVEFSARPVWTGRLSGDPMPTSEFYLQAALNQERQGWMAVAEAHGRLGSGDREVTWLSRPSSLSEGSYVLLVACDALCLGLKLTVQGVRGSSVRGSNVAATLQRRIEFSWPGSSERLPVDVQMGNCGSGSCSYSMALLWRGLS